MQPAKPMFRKFLWTLLASLWLASCNFPALNRASPTPPGPSPTASPPTATPIPIAASVNGEGIALAFFEAEVTRFEQAQAGAGTDLATLSDYKTRVLDELIDLKLLSLGAIQSGREVSLAEIEAHIADIVTARGSQAA